ncbi:MAG: hypothetical protein ACLQVM_09330 [Terriglobia bacterium]
MLREYTTAKAFPTALEDRLNKTAGAEKIQVNRLRRQLSLAAAGRSLDKQRLLHARGEIHHFQGHLVDDILGLAQLTGELLP